MAGIVRSLLVIFAVAAVSGGATWSYFSDTKTIEGNTFSAGTLKLKVNGEDQVAGKTFSNMKPGDQPNFTWKIKNNGSIGGYLNLKNIATTQNDLGGVLHLRIMIDNNCNGWRESDDQILWQGYAKDAPGNIKANKFLAPGAEICLNNLVNWWSTPRDNDAQGQTMQYDITFDLTQNQIQ